MDSATAMARVASLSSNPARADFMTPLTCVQLDQVAGNPSGRSLQDWSNTLFAGFHGACPATPVPIRAEYITCLGPIGFAPADVVNWLMTNR